MGNLYTAELNGQATDAFIPRSRALPRHDLDRVMTLERLSHLHNGTQAWMPKQEDQIMAKHLQETCSLLPF